MDVASGSTSSSLAAVGLSQADIALLAGFGRNVGTWMRAQSTDRSFLEVLGIDQEQIIPRTGLLSVSSLQKRWSNRLILFRDGRLLDLARHDVKTILDNQQLDLFTWFMTLVISALCASCSQSTAISVLSTFLIERCAESDGGEYILREMQRNLEGWISIARTRTIIQAAETSWDQLERQGTHETGFIPENDHHELVSFLTWLSGAGEGGKSSRLYYTGSTDTCALALLLNEIGFESLQAGCTSEGYLESQIVVVLDTARLSHRDTGSRPKRKGMRVNICSLEEVVSLWPGPPAENNKRRKTFLMGKQASEGIECRAAQLATSESARDNNLEPLCAFLFKTYDRASTEVHRFCEEFLLAPSIEAANEVQRLFLSWQLHKKPLSYVLDDAVKRKTDRAAPKFIADIQIFLLGYYYGLLFPLMDFSRMAVREAFASWTWNDFEIIHLIQSNKLFHEVMDPRSGDTVRYVQRSSILRLASFLFAGAESYQISAIRRGSCGVHGKLTICDATLLGDADNSSRINTFVLLDVDKVFFPSNDHGIMTPGGRTDHPFTSSRDGKLHRIETINIPKSTEDFTSLIEPKWGYDQNAMMVSYRRKGRLVCSADPEWIYHSVLGTSLVSTPVEDENGYQYRHALATEEASLGSGSFDLIDGIEAQTIPLSRFDGGKVPLFEGMKTESNILCIATNGLPKMRSCLTSLYFIETSQSPSDARKLFPMMANLKFQISSYWPEALIAANGNGMTVIR